MSDSSTNRESSVSANKSVTITIYINGGSHRVSKRPMTGADLRALPSPPIDTEYEFIQVREGENADILIREDQVVEIKDGDHFVAVPHTILAG